jgi:hypothetical protein
MKSFIIPLLSLLVFSACERFDDPIPEGATLEFPVLIADVVSPTEVLLSWSSHQICAGFCPDIVPASSYEIWAKSLNASIDFKLATVQAGEMTYLAKGLEVGVAQEFFVIAKRANVSHETNRVMVVPNELPTVTFLFQKESFDYITHPQVSPDGTEVVYALSKAGASGSSQNIFLYDLRSRSERLIKENGQYPSWSGDGKKLTFVSEMPTASMITEFVFDTGATEVVMSNSFKSYFPQYIEENESLLYFLDSLDEGESWIVSLGLAIPDTTFLRKVDLERNTHAPVLGMDFSPKSNEVAYSSIFPKDTKRGFSYDVVGFDLENPANLTNWVVSEWNDTNPAFSSANPNMLAFVSDRSGVPQVWIKNSQTQKLFQVTDFQGSERINMGIAGLSWNGKNLFVNIQDVQGITRMVSIDVSSLL